jgi:glycosyltransferase involved in cell wall biosynthesis
MSRLTAVFSAGFLGGGELFNLEFLRRAQELGVQIDAIVPSEGTVADALRPFALSLQVVQPPAPLRAVSRFDRTIPLRMLPEMMLSLSRYASRLRQALRATSGPLCSLGFRSQLAVAVAGRGLGRPTCWIVHEVVPEGIFTRLWSLAARHTDAVFVYSDAAGSQPALVKASASVSVLPVRLELEPYLEVTLPTPPPRVLGLVGDLFPIKNQLALVEIVRRLRASGEAVEGRMFGRDTSGTNPTADYVQAVCSATGPDVQLTAVEPVEMPQRLAEIDLLLHLTTVPETFGRVCVEAMAAGRPVIAFDHGAVSDVVESERTGILCPVGDLDGVEHAIRRLRAEEELFRELSITGRVVARERWGPGQPGPFIGDALAAFAA